LPPDSDVFVYIRAGRIEELKTLLIEGRASILDIAAPFGFSTLSLALSYGRMDIYELLLSAGANRCSPVFPDTTGIHLFEFWIKFASPDYKMSAAAILQDDIHHTASVMDARLLDRMLTYPNLESSSFTRLHKCVLGLTTESLRSILPTVSDIDEVDSVGRTALHLAAYKNDAHTMTLLLSWGADPEIIDHTGKTPLHISASLGSVPCTTALAAHGADLHARDQFGRTPLHHACKLGHLPVVQALLSCKADSEATDFSGDTPLINANFGGNLTIIQLLSQHQANLSHRDEIGFTIVHDTIWFNLHEALQAHLDVPLRVDQKLQNGKSTLHLLAEEGDEATMRIFLASARNGLDRLVVEDRDDRGRTAVDYLKCRRDVAEVEEIFRLVLRRVRDAAGLAGLGLGGGEGNEVFFDAVEGHP
jgi:ankyrin repeat protein